MKYLLAVLLFLASAVHAELLSLRLTFNVANVTVSGLGSGGPFITPSQYFGTLVTDTSVLLNDGPIVAGRVYAFEAHIGDATLLFPPFAGGHQGNVFAAALRGPCFVMGFTCTPEQQAVWGFNSQFLPFTVFNHQIVGIPGGDIFGLASDFPFIDFFGNRYTSATFLGNFSALDRVDVFIDGPLQISVIPEPGTFALVLLPALLGLFMRSARQFIR